MRDLGTDLRPFVCEIPIKDSYKIITEKRVIGKNDKINLKCKKKIKFDLKKRLWFAVNN